MLHSTAFPTRITPLLDLLRHAAETAQFLEDQGAITWTYGRNFGPHFDQVQIDYMEEYEEDKAPTHRTLHPAVENDPLGGRGRHDRRLPAVGRGQRSDPTHQSSRRKVVTNSQG